MVGRSLHSRNADPYESIIAICKRWSEFWPNSGGWGTEEISEMFEQRSMDRLVSMAQSLRHWGDRLEVNATEGELILAWVNLGALVEGALKLFFCVYYNDWNNDPDAPAYKNEKRMQIDTFFDKLIQFHLEKSEGADRNFLENIRDQRNLIHPLKVGFVFGVEAFRESLALSANLFLSVEGRLPYPTEYPIYR
jgi:hypothetical protein